MVRFWCRRIMVGVSLLFVVMSAVGKSSKVVMSWKNPAYVRTKPFSRVLALGLSDKAKIRADFEDALAAQLADTGVETIPGNTILLRPEGTHLDLQYLKTQVRENKLDAVVVSRLIKVDNTVTYVPGTAYVPPPLPYYGTFYGYYGAVYPMVYTPGYLKEEKKVRIETNLYVVSSGEGELVWTGITDTFNPTDVNKAIGRLVKLLVKQMRSDGAF
ncbi:MAG TPA: hypothetical protein VFA40_06530 [Terriglobales bacterium]|nr:hypothetical protein [Terriglobales bacterium]